MAQKNWCRTVLHQFFSFIEPEILLGRAVRRGSLPLARGRTGRLSAAQLRDGGLGRHLFGRPRKAPLFRVPLPFQSSGGQSPPSGKKISGFQPEILLGRAVRRGSLPLARGRTGRLSAAQLRDGGLGRHLFGLFFAVAFTGAHGGAVQVQSTSTKKRLSWSGPSSPVRRYFSTWPLSRWTSS